MHVAEKIFPGPVVHPQYTRFESILFNFRILYTFNDVMSPLEVSRIGTATGAKIFFFAVNEQLA